MVQKLLKPVPSPPPSIHLAPLPPPRHSNLPVKISASAASDESQINCRRAVQDETYNGSLSNFYAV